MTAPQEPLVMTLEEVAEYISHHPESGYGSDFPLSLARTREGWVVLTWLGNTAAYLLNAEPHMRWDDAVRAAGVPVVARDDAAELRAALEGLVPVALALTDLAVSGFDLSPTGTVTAIAKARAALAATEGES